jgi:hypothetical protein
LTVLIVLLFSYNAVAAIYDDFTGTVIDTTKWTAVGNAGFTQNDSLIFDDSALNTHATLISTATFSGDFRVRVEFYDFSSTTHYASGYTGTASSTALGLGGPGGVQVIVARMHRLDGEQFASFLWDSVLQTWASPRTWVLTSVTQGQLAFRYIGGTVIALYNETMDPYSGWLPLGSYTSAALGWTGAPRIVLVGRNDGTHDAGVPDGSTYFRMDNVAYAAIPIPPAVLLFAPALAGLAALRGRFKK